MSESHSTQASLGIEHLPHGGAEQLQTFIDHAPAALAMIDRSRRYLHASRRWRQDFRLDALDQRAKLEDLAVADLSEAWRDAHRRALSGDVARSDLDRVRRPDGSEFWARWEVRPWHEGGGEVGGTLVHVEDITERVTAEALLRESERRLSTLMANLPGLAYRCRNSPDWPMEFMSERTLDLTGYPPQEFQEGRVSFGSLIVEADRDRVWDAVQVALARRVPFTLEYRIRRADGEERWVWEQGRGVHDEKGELLALEGFIVDTTERRQAEEGLRESEANFRGFFENVGIGAAQLNEAARFVRVNDRYCQITGFSREELLGGMTPFDLDHPEDRPADRDRVFRFLGGADKVYENEKRYLRKDGKIAWVHVSATPVYDREGRFRYSAAVVEDITARKIAEEARRKLESQVQHAQKLESLGVLAGGIAHDFNNLLTSVLGYADLALQALPADSPARASIAGAADGARRAADLTKQLLAYSGKGKFVVEPVDLSALTRDLTRLLTISISKRVLLTLNLAPDLPTIDADATQMRQVLMNLVINASEAIGERSGHITVSTGSLQCDARYLRDTFLDEELAEGLYVSLEVADDGCGMSKETLAKLFDPFFTTKFTGRGLGLSAVLGIVRGHHGAIKVYSEPGMGTTFRVLFPASSSAAAGVAAHPPAIDDWRGSGTVLIIDDDETVRGVARHMLETMGFDVLCAAGGEEGIEALRMHQATIRFILLDLTMPQLDGEETFRELRRLRGDVRVILSSGYNHQSVVSRFAGTGLAGFIQKPYRYEDLRHEVRRVLGAAAT